MEYVIFIIIGVAIWFAITYAKDNNATSDSSTQRDRNKSAVRPPNFDDPASIKQQYIRDSADWLNERWERAEQNRNSSENSEFQSWYYEEPSERQFKFVDDLGIAKAAKGKTKGQVSDLIGMFKNPEDSELTVLKFFNVSAKGMSQTQARDVVGKLFSTTENRDSWKKRPPTTMQREFYKFFDISSPKGMTYEQMKADIDSRSNSLDEDGISEWFEYESLYDDLSDAEFRKDMEMKKVSLTMFRAVMKEKRQAGVKMGDLDCYDIAEELLEKHPELARS